LQTQFSAFFNKKITKNYFLIVIKIFLMQIL
jgi:hypothetical protein